MSNTSCTIITPASLRSDCCSPSFRNAVRLPSGIDVHLHRNTHIAKTRIVFVLICALLLLLNILILNLRKRDFVNYIIAQVWLDL